jgi:hypothetical protein
VRWVVDRVAEREGGPAEAVAVTRPAGWEADRTELLAGALAEQDVDATFLTTSRAAEWHPSGSGPDGASAAACGAAVALRSGGSDGGSDDVVARLAALARLPDVASSPASSDDDDGPAVPAPRSHHSGGWAAAGIDGSGGHRAAEDPVDGSGAHRAGPSDDQDDDLIAALGGFTGTLGATNTAGLLSGYTPPSGLAASGQATALVVDDGERLALPTQRSGSGRWAAVADAADEEFEPDAELASASRPDRSPAALVSIGGAAAAVAVVATLFLWPAPRTTNSAISRPVPLVPAVAGPAAPTADLTPTPTAAPTTTRPRPAPARARRAAAPPPAETTPAPSVTSEPTEPATSSEPPPSESTAPPTTTKKPDDD